MLLSLLMRSTTAQASSETCLREVDRVRLEDFQERIIAAESPEQAKELVLTQTRIGRKAIQRASRILPENQGVSEAEARLTIFEAKIDDASSQREVADVVQSNSTALNCDYTTTEVVIIVIGLLLGILPGLLFLVLFC